jgi:hypothetical protein
MTNGSSSADRDLDAAPRAFKSLDRELSRRSTRTTRSKEDANAIRALIEAWFRTYRPALAEVFGDLPAVDNVDRDLRDLLSIVGSKMVISDLRARLRAVARMIERDILPAYDAARWTTAAAPATRQVQPSGPLVTRLRSLSPELADSYEQVQADLQDGARMTFLGTAGEIREVMRATIHLLSPDEEVAAQEWFVGDDNGRPTQAERIRFVVQSKSGADSAIEAAEIIDTKVGRFGRQLYQRASKSFHAGTQRDEVGRIATWVDAVLNEILPT